MLIAVAGCAERSRALCDASAQIQARIPRWRLPTRMRDGASRTGDGALEAALLLQFGAGSAHDAGPALDLVCDEAAGLIPAWR